MARPHLLPPSPSPITNSCTLPPPIHVACGISNYMPQRMDPLKRSAAGSICLRQPKHLMAAGRNDVDLFRVESAPLQLQALDYGFNGRRSVTWIRQEAELTSGPIVGLAIEGDSRRADHIFMQSWPHFQSL